MNQKYEMKYTLLVESVYFSLRVFGIREQEFSIPLLICKIGRTLIR